MEDAISTQRIADKFESLTVMMDERMCRQWAATEARAYGWGGIEAVSIATGMSPHSIRKGLRELESRGKTPSAPIPQRICAAGAGRKQSTVADSELETALERLVDPATRGEPPVVAVTQPGDLWILGKHKLLCGDSTNPACVAQLMGSEKAALVATDPPYLVDYTGERPNDSGKDWTVSYREIDITYADTFFRALFTNVLQVLAPHSAIYCWHAHKRQALIARVWEDLSILDHQQIVWVKPTPVFGRVFWHFRHEPCMMGWVQGSQPTHDGDQSFNSVWEIDWEGKAWIVGNDHPTQKPVEIFARPMRKYTKIGDLCFEPFSGSGSQLIAAEQTNRRCYAMEISPIFVDVAVKRWELFTGKKAERIAAGA